MKVRSKLYLNMIVTVAGIALIAGASLVGMRFVQGKVSLLTERSTPYQLKTIELQRSLQEHTSNLLKVGGSLSLQELAAARTEADKTLAGVHNAARELAGFKGAAEAGESGLGELDAITREMIATTDARIRAEEGARSADLQMKEKLQTISQKLKSLDTSVRRVQKGSMAQLNTSNDGVKRITKRVKNVQAALNSLNDVKVSLLEIAAAENKAGVTVGRSHFTVASRWVTQGELAKTEKDNTAVKELVDGIGEITKKVTGPQGLIELRNALLAKPEDETRKKFGEVYALANQKLAQMTVIMGDLVEKASEEFAAENRSFDESLKGSETAGTKLSSNSELLAQGADISMTAKEMFGVRSVKELEAFRAEIERKFAAAAAIQGRIAGKGKGEDARLIGQVAAALGDIRGLLFSRDGAYDKLSQKLQVESQALAINEKLKGLVAKQREESIRSATAAQGEQARAVASVNRVVRTFVTSVAVMGLAVLAFGIIFSVLLGRSITRPIEELSDIAEGFGNGNFNKRMDEKRKDEFGALAGHFNQAAGRLSEMAHRLSGAIANLAAHSRQLSGTAEELSTGARQQASQTEQSASAMTEMSQTIDEVAGNAHTAADATREALGAASKGNEVVGRTVEGMERIASSVREAAALIGQLGQSSEQIGSIIAVINEIADQTNLLALNAAIEAARAGEAGMGFAVVADEVRRLAHRTTEATGEIGAMVKAIQSGTARSVAAMENGSASVGEGVQLAGEARDSLRLIVEVSGRGAGMVERIAAAAEEQSATAQQVNASVEQIAQITRRTEQSMGEITHSSDELARIAEELSRMAEWFKVEGQRAA